MAFIIRNQSFSYVSILAILSLPRAYIYKKTAIIKEVIIEITFLLFLFFFALFYMCNYVHALNNKEWIKCCKSVNLHSLCTVIDLYGVKQRNTYHWLQSGYQGDDLCHVWLQIDSQNKQYHSERKISAGIESITLKRSCVKDARKTCIQDLIFKKKIQLCWKYAYNWERKYHP